MHHLPGLVPYQRVRSAEEYSEPYHESHVAQQLTKEWGFSNVRTAVDQQGGTAYQPMRGELWMTSPKLIRILDFMLLRLRQHRRMRVQGCWVSWSISVQGARRISMARTSREGSSCPRERPARSTRWLSSVAPLECWL